jgi:hypothetical protein
MSQFAFLQDLRPLVFQPMRCVDRVDPPSKADIAKRRGSAMSTRSMAAVRLTQRETYTIPPGAAGLFAPEL